jgi:hypothetical protein
MSHLVVKEICAHVPELSEHAAVLEAIVDRLGMRNFDLACRYDAQVSMTTWAQGAGIVRLAVKNGAGGRTVIFDLLHELGHIESGEPTVHHHVDQVDYKREQKRRELQAWSVAERLLTEFGLELYRDEFVCRRDYCLATYGIEPN